KLSSWSPSRCTLPSAQIRASASPGPGRCLAPAIKCLCVARDPSGAAKTPAPIASGPGVSGRNCLAGKARPRSFAGGDQIRVLTRCRGQARENAPATLDGDAPHLIGAVDAAPFPGLAIPPVLLRRPHVEEAGELHGANAAHDLDPVVPGLTIEPHPDLGVG